MIISGLYGLCSIFIFKLTFNCLLWVGKNPCYPYTDFYFFESKRELEVFL